MLRTFRFVTAVLIGCVAGLSQTAVNSAAPGRSSAVERAADYNNKASRPTLREIMQGAAERQRSSAALQTQAVASQREAWRKQEELIGTLPESGAPLPAPDCEPMPDSAIRPIIEAAAKAQSLDLKLVDAVVERESGYRPCAVSPKGALGLMQLMPDTADQFEVTDPFDPKQNVEAGVMFLKQLIDRYKGDLGLALGAYNAGPRATDQAGGIPPIQETRDYVDAILKKAGMAPLAIIDPR